MNLIVATSVAVLIIAGAGLAWEAGGPGSDRRTWATPLRLVVLGYVVFDGIGAVLIAAAGEGFGGPLLIGGAFVAMGLGAQIVKRPLGPPAPVPSAVVVGRIARPVVVAMTILGLAMYLALALDAGVPLLTADAQAARASWGGIRLDLFRWLVPPAAILATGVALATGRRDHAVVAIASVVAVVVLEVAAASRALPFEIALAVLLVALWAGRQPAIRSWVLLGAAAGLVFFGVLFARVAPEGSFSGPVDAVSFAANRFVERVVLIQPRTVEAVVAAFPDEEPYLGGSTYVRWAAGLTGRPAPSALGEVLFARLFPGEPPGGFAAPGVLGEAYGNFGVIWALATMVGLGALAAALGVWLPRAVPDAPTRAVAALLAVALLRTYATSLNGFALTAVAAIGWWMLSSGTLSDLVRRILRGRGTSAGGRTAQLSTPAKNGRTDDG